MMQCLSFNFNSSSSRPPPSFPPSPQSQSQIQTQAHLKPNSQDNSTEGTPRSSTSHLSPSFNLTDEYTRATQTNSYNEIRSRIEDHVVQIENEIEIEGTEDSHHLHLSQVLHPNRECVHQVLRHTNPKATLTRLVSTYFDHSENISTLCLKLYQCISRARALYAPITDLLQVFPLELSSISPSQCDWAFNIFLQFDSLENPFPSPDSDDFNEMRRSFSQLKDQLDQRLHKTRTKGQLLDHVTTRSAVCLIGTVVAVSVSVVVISTHALGAIVGLVATPLCPFYVPAHVKKKRHARAAQLESASSGTFFHIKDLDTIGCLVSWLHGSVERDRELIQFALTRGRDIYPIHEVVIRLRKNQNKTFLDQLKELEEHICLCFNVVNKFRAKLFDQINLNQYTDS